MWNLLARARGGARHPRDSKRGAKSDERTVAARRFRRSIAIVTTLFRGRGGPISSLSSAFKDVATTTNARGFDHEFAFR
jgi:hypothetical protein